jgi:hypothetical protein
MNISVRVSLSGRGGALVGDPALGLSGSDFWADYDYGDPRLTRVFERSGPDGGFLFVPRIAFSRAELDKAAFFEVSPSRTLPGESADLKRLSAIVAGTARRDCGGTLGTGVRLIRGLALPPSRVTKVAKGGIQAVSDDVPEYVVGASVVDHFAKAGLLGWRSIAVTNLKTEKPFTDTYLLASESFTGPVDVEESFLSDKKSNGLSRIKNLVFPKESLAGIPDFSRSADPLEVNEFPSWIVSQRVRGVLHGHRIKGWSLEPVIAAGSDLHEGSQRLWAQVMADITRNPSNEIGPFRSLSIKLLHS